MARKPQTADVAERLQEIHDELNEELLQLSSIDEDLTPEQERRLNALNSAVPDLEDAIAALADEDELGDGEELDEAMGSDEPE